MTDAPTLDDERTARLARLRERRGQDAPTLGELAAPAPVDRAPTDRPAGSAAHRPGASTDATPALSAPGTRPPARRRRATATNAKIVTVGASATAVLGMIAGYGIADGLTADASGSATTVDTPTAAIPTVGEIPPASPATTPATTAAPTQPQVIVVVVDGATGRTLSTTTGTGDLAADLAAAGVTPATSSDTATGEMASSQPATGSSPAADTAIATEPAAPAPVPQPAAVDLAVPAPPPPPPAPAAPAPAPAPQPEATSSGS